jgi:hypothetical protein
MLLKTHFDVKIHCSTLSPLKSITIVDLQLLIKSKCHHEKNRCADAIVEAISLSTSFILLIALNFCCVYANLLISVLTLIPSLQMLSPSNMLSLSLSLPLSLLVSSLSLLFCHTQPISAFFVYH